MQESVEELPGIAFPDRRHASNGPKPFGERRQFVDSRSSFRPEVLELSEAVDQYKLRHRRRFITFEELFDVMWSLGYRKVASEE